MRDAVIIINNFAVTIFFFEKQEKNKQKNAYLVIFRKFLGND